MALHRLSSRTDREPQRWRSSRSRSISPSPSPSPHRHHRPHRSRSRSLSSSVSRSHYHRSPYSRGRCRSPERRRRYSRSTSWSPVHGFRHSRSRSFSFRDSRSRSRSMSPLPRRGSSRRGDRDSRRRDETGKPEKALSDLISDFVDGIAQQQQAKSDDTAIQAPQLTDVEELLMKKFGIPVSFNSTKGKCVPDANCYAVKLCTKRQPRQYMNRRGGFNRMLPSEKNK